MTYMRALVIALMIGLTFIVSPVSTVPVHASSQFTQYCDWYPGPLNAYVSGDFGYNGSSVWLVSGPYDAGCYNGNGVTSQGPGVYIQGTNIYFWWNVKFSTSGGYKCLYPRAYGTASGGYAGYDGANGSGSCSF